MWIKTRALFRNLDITSAEWELYSDEQKSNSCHEADYVFDSNELECFNSSSIDGAITLNFKSGYNCMIKMSMRELYEKLKSTSTN